MDHFRVQIQFFRRPVQTIVSRLDPVWGLCGTALTGQALAQRRGRASWTCRSGYRSRAGAKAPTDMVGGLEVLGEIVLSSSGEKDAGLFDILVRESALASVRKQLFPDWPAPDVAPIAARRGIPSPGGPTVLPERAPSANLAPGLGVIRGMSINVFL